MKRYFSRSYGDTKKKVSSTRAWHRVSPCGSNLSPLLAPSAASHPPLAYLFFLVDDVPRLNRLTTAMRELVFLVPLISRILGGNRAREKGRRGGSATRLKLFSELDVRARAEARQLLIILLAGACVECLTTVEDGFVFPKLVRRILASSWHSLATPKPRCPFSFVSPLGALRHGGSVIYIDAHENPRHASTLIFLHDVVGNEHLSH